MDQENLDLTGLTDEQKKAIEHYAEKQKGRYFISSTPHMIIKDFLAANKQMQGPDPGTVERGRKYEQNLRKYCLSSPPPTKQPTS